MLPSEAFISPTPVPWDRRDPDAHTTDANPGGEPGPDAREDVALQGVTASLDLFPTVAIVRATALLQGPAGELRRVGIPQFTQWVRAAPLAEFEVRIDGRPVAPELIRGTSASIIADRPRRSDDWWVWPVELTAAPVRIDMDYTQALSEPERTNDRMRVFGFHVVGDGTLWRGPIQSIEFSLHLHGIDRDSVTTRLAPTTVTADGFTWSLKNVEIADSSPGAVIDMPVARLPGRDVIRAAYFPADAPAHLVVHDYVVRFALVCAAPTSAEWERLIDRLREVAERSDEPLARSWAAATLGDLGHWCTHDSDDFAESDDPEVARCEQWLTVAAPESSSPPPRTLERPPWCWERSWTHESSLLVAANRREWRRIGLWSAGFAGLAISVAVGLWIRRRRRPAPDSRRDENI